MGRGSGRLVIMQLMTMMVSREVGTDDETTDYLMMMVSTVGWVVAAMVSGQGPLPPCLPQYSSIV